VNNSRHIQQVVDVKANTTYSFEFKGRIQNAVGASGTQPNHHESNGIATLKGEVLTPDNDLLLLLESQESVDQHLVGDFQTSNNTYSVTVRINKNWNVAYVDEVLLEEKNSTGNHVLFPTSTIKFKNLKQGLRIESSSPMDSIEIYDLAGRLIKNFFLPGQAKDVVPLKNGMYIISVNLKEGASLKKKYVVNS
jgi:hypothetical protein